MPSEMELATRLNGYLRASSGPYTVRGAAVVVTPQFRMEGGIGKKNLPGIEKAVGPTAWREIATDAAWATTGKGSLDAIRKTTQALIDSPEFRKYAHLDAETAVRKLQWDFGIGQDCSGYVHQAFLFARGSGNGSAPSARFGLGKVEQSGLQSLPGPHFRRVEPGQVRAGDIIVLANGSDETGHKVIVHGRNTAPPGTELHARAVEQLGGGRDARIHVITVDSSERLSPRLQRRGLYARHEDSNRTLRSFAPAQDRLSVSEQGVWVAWNDRVERLSPGLVRQERVDLGVPPNAEAPAPRISVDARSGRVATDDGRLAARFGAEWVAVVELGREVWHATDEVELRQDRVKGVIWAFGRAVIVRDAPGVGVTVIEPF
ncbi:MAG: hypothetical protein HYZ29_10220 [Myxococcales bacterium]|nr:hypothetical protein [Myxococcales bacterium]